MMRISVNEFPSGVTLKVEGKLAGPWAVELGNIWQDLGASIRRKPLRLDICGVSFVDQNGTQILQQIVRATSAEILADSPLTQYFADQARNTPATGKREEN